MRLFDKADLLHILDLKTQGMSHSQIAEIMGCGKSTITDFVGRTTYKDFWDSVEDDSKPVALGETLEPEHRRRKLSGRTFVFTSAQNNTHVHRPFLQSLKNYCDLNDAEMIVSTFTYNKNGFQNSVKTDDGLWYDPLIRPYLCNDTLEVADDLYFCGELNILPTAVRPLSGFNNYTGSASAIIPHAKMQLESVPTSKYAPTKFLYTTGCVTQRNYIEKKSGQIASWHHVYGALVVEIDDEGDWFVRQIIADSETGHFYDLDCLYTPDGIYNGQRILAVNYGDVHVAKLDDAVADLAWRQEGSIRHDLKPEYQFVHDVFDHQARNHHNVNNPHVQYSLYVNGVDCVDFEIAETAQELLLMQSEDSQVVVVDSNHDKALERWLREADYRKDPTNALTFLELQLAKYKSIADGDHDFHLFEYAIKNQLQKVGKGCDIRFLREDESFILEGIEFGVHGHNGNNGARGSVRAYDMQGVKHNIGHSHSAAIFNGIYVAGVSGELCMGYNSGGSSWSHSHIVTYKNGKRAIITMKKSKTTGEAKWRAC